MYHKNTIINKDILPLVGIDVFQLQELVLLIAGTMWFLYSLLERQYGLSITHEDPLSYSMGCASLSVIP